VDGARIVAALEESATSCVMYAPTVLLGYPRLGKLFPEVARYLRTHYRRDGAFRGDGVEWYALVRRTS
jgi:hypothetical protein